MISMHSFPTWLKGVTTNYSATDANAAQDNNEDDLFDVERTSSQRLTIEAADELILTSNKACGLRSSFASTAFNHSERLKPRHHLAQPNSIDEHLELVSHYFTSVCVINSCYDSVINPFRTEIQTLMSSSRLIYYCVLSMSAAHLVRNNRRWSPRSLEYLTEALSALAKEVAQVIAGRTTPSAAAEQNVDQVLLGVIILGMTTSWHESSGLGLEHVVGSRILFQQWTRDEFEYHHPPLWPKLSFYLGLQAYWETVVSFLIDQDITKLDYLHAACNKLPLEKIYPNPWTGISTVVWVLLAKVGCVIRRKRMLTAVHGGRRPATSLRQLHEDAKLLETQLLNCSIPNDSEVEDIHDERTPLGHLQDIARCCKFAALLELYRAFSTVYDWQSAQSLTEEFQRDNLSDNLYLEEDGLILNSANIIPQLSMRILIIILSIPRNSGTICIHHVLLLIAGGALSKSLFPSSTSHMSSPCIFHASPGTLTLPTFGLEYTDSFNISVWRSLVLDRITYLERLINLDVIQRIRVLLQEVWARDNMEASGGFPQAEDSPYSAHWLDVMVEKNLEFLF
jgi:hypothetical protein